MRLARPGLLLVVVCWALASASAAAATSFPVTNTGDSGDGSLRNAIEAANFVPGPDSIPISASGTIGLASALPVITGPLAISGPGPEKLTIRRAVGFPFRILELTETGGGAVADSISGVTIANGLSGGGSGILDEVDSLTLTRVALTGNVAEARSAEGTAAAGGALASRGGAVTIRESTVSGNLALAVAGTTNASAIGGGLQILGSLRIEDSTISGNVADATALVGLAAAQGGGLFYESGDGEPAAIVRSTVSGNIARTGGTKSLSASGGGIDSFLGGLTITGSTVSGNQVSVATGAGASAANLAMTKGDAIGDSIVSRPLGAASCSGAIPSLGFNIEDGGGCGFTQPSDHFNVDPGLDPQLADNGGPTPTLALRPGSVAIDRGSAFGSSADQRGLARPSDFASVPNAAGGDGSDVGAFELQPAAAPPLPPPVPAPPRRIVRKPKRGSGGVARPVTRIERGPARRTHSRRAVFRFSSSRPRSHFQCKLDRKPFRPCPSPFVVKVGAAPGAGAAHVLAVRAVDDAGNADRTPAKFSWRVIGAG